MTDPWWAAEFKISKNNRRKKYMRGFPAYELRKDNQVASQGVVSLFLAACKVPENHTTAFFDALRLWGKEKELTFENLFELMGRFGQRNDESKSLVNDMMTSITCSEAGKLVQQNSGLEKIFTYLPQLLPRKFEFLIHRTSPRVLEELEEALTKEPWIFGYSNVLYKKYKLPGCEASLQRFEDCDLIKKLTKLQEHALRVYDVLKFLCNSYGHTYVYENSVTKSKRLQNCSVANIEEAYGFLVYHQVVHQEVDKHRNQQRLYLYKLWNAEVYIAEKLADLLEQQRHTPFAFGIDFDSEPYTDLVGDYDQVRAAMLISQQPVVVMSGRGGCGKTHVISMLCRTMESLIHQDQKEEEALEKNEFDDSGLLSGEDQATQDKAFEADGISCTDHGSGGVSEKKCDNPTILLTAPTGKAAKLLGNRAKMPSFTLHHVIYSYRAWVKESEKKQAAGEESNPWKFSKVVVLVVDECSLVSVQTFSAVLRKLCEESELRKVILLGDTHQLPSIQPGNFLADVYRSLDQIGCSVTLRTNHRTDCELLVENAGRIAQQQIPRIDPGKHFHQIDLPEVRPSLLDTDQDCPDWEQDNAVRRLLMENTPDIGSHERSQFVAFRRKDCRSINEICCSFYANHPTMNEKGHIQFRVGDKVCCTKNGNVRDHTEKIPSSQGEDNARKGDDTVKLCNGEIFFIRDDHEFIENNGKTKRFLTLDNLEMTVKVDYRELMRECSLQHAWARTIHTYQGSESDTVIYLVGSARRQTWQHVYTAVTRGRQQVIIITRPSELETSVKTLADRRYTSLAEKLTAELQNLGISKKTGKSPTKGNSRPLNTSQQATASQQDNMKKAASKTLDFSHRIQSNRSYVSKSPDKTKQLSGFNNSGFVCNSQPKSSQGKLSPCESGGDGIDQINDDFEDMAQDLVLMSPVGGSSSVQPGAAPATQTRDEQQISSTATIDGAATSVCCLSSKQQKLPLLNFSQLSSDANSPFGRQAMTDEDLVFSPWDDSVRENVLAFDSYVCDGEDAGKVDNVRNRAMASASPVGLQTVEETEEVMGDTESREADRTDSHPWAGNTSEIRSPGKRKSDKFSRVEEQEEEWSDGQLTPTKDTEDILKGIDWKTAVTPPKMSRREETAKASPVRKLLEKFQLG